MKKYILISLAVLFAGFVFTACEDNEKFIPTDTPSVFHFTAASASVAEVELNEKGEPDGDENTLKLTVIWSKYKPASGNVTLEVIPVSMIGTNPVVPAIEGEDYTISTKSLSFTEDGDGMYTQTVTITTKYDPTFTGAKYFDVKIVNSTVEGARIGATGAGESCRITINDVNHPLVALIGKATLSYTCYWDGPVSFVADIKPDLDDTDVLWMTPNMRTGTLNAPMKLVVKNTDDDEGFEVSISFPQDGGLNGSTPFTYCATSEQRGYFTRDDVTIVATTPKDAIDIFFEDQAGFIQISEANSAAEFALWGTVRITK